MPTTSSTSYPLIQNVSLPSKGRMLRFSVTVLVRVEELSGRQTCSVGALVVGIEEFPSIRIGPPTRQVYLRRHNVAWKHSNNVWIAIARTADSICSIDWKNCKRCGLPLLHPGHSVGRAKSLQLPRGRGLFAARIERSLTRAWRRLRDLSLEKLPRNLRSHPRYFLAVRSQITEFDIWLC